MGGKKGQSNGLGKALIKKHQSKHIKKVELGEMHKHTTDIISTEKPKIMSIIDQNSLDEFVQLAQLSNKAFTAEKEITIVNRKEVLQGSTESANAQRELLGNFLLTDSTVRNPKYKLLKIPRRPKWKKDMSAEEI
jgi:large subunit GTPase 1